MEPADMIRWLKISLPKMVPTPKLEWVINKETNAANNSGDEAPATSTSETDKSVPESLGQNKSDFTLETATAGNKDTVSKFDDLFNE